MERPDPMRVRGRSWRASFERAAWCACIASMVLMMARLLLAYLDELWVNGVLIVGVFCFALVIDRIVCYARARRDADIFA